ncbi:hypothetical protein L2E82_45566 [Cichorium intybus]|uniref:Uncharacterized protein n=1 Tax=Cichorium intybus TaxID=13427 RepID=A0ACB8ZTC6_CICIN|nr:hypothetical protein L2E82_45566 [Cichorium intybus]
MFCLVPSRVKPTEIENLNREIASRAQRYLLELLNIEYAAFDGLRNPGFRSGLKILKVSNCPKITVLGISMALEACKSLEYLDVRSCPNVTKADCDDAGLKFPEGCKTGIENLNQQIELTSKLST